MADFFQAVGDANLLGSFNQALQGMGAMEKMKSYEQEQAVNNLRLQAETLNIKKAQEEYDADRTPISLESLKRKGSVFPGFTDETHKMMSDLGLVKDINGIPSTTPFSIKNFQKLVSSNNELGVQLAVTQHQDIQKNIYNLTEQRMNEKDTEKQKAIAEQIANFEKRDQNLLKLMGKKTENKIIPQGAALVTDTGQPVFQNAPKADLSAFSTLYKEFALDNGIDLNTPTGVAQLKQIISTPEGKTAFVGYIEKMKKAGQKEPNAPGSLAEFEMAYKNKGGDIEKIKGTPAYEKEWQNWKKATLTPGAQIKVSIDNAKQAPSGNNFSQWTPEEKEMGFNRALLGDKPAFGYGRAAAENRQAFEKEYNSWLTKGGTSAQDATAIRNKSAALKQAYAGLKKSTANFSAFEKAMLANMDYSVSLSEKFPRTEYPPLNKVINAIKTGTGDPDVVKFGTSIYAAALEFEKIRTAGTNITSAELSIGAQKKAEEILNKAQTHKQHKAILEAMKTDTKNVMNARHSELNKLEDEMKRLGKPGSEMTTTPKIETPTSVKVWKLKNGKWTLE